MARTTFTKLAAALLMLALAAGPSFADKSTKPQYSLAASPLKIMDRLPELKMGTLPPMTDAERQTLTKIWDLKSDKTAEAKPIDQALLLDAIIFSSGIDAPLSRKKYRDQFEKIVTGAKAATKSAKSMRDKGEALMKFLHGGVMSKGYELHQTSWTLTLDSGKFNCVSSTAMYYLVGTRLGMQFRIISIPGTAYSPGHAALDLLDGKNFITVEPTNPDGFDWDTKSKRPGFVVIGHVADRKTGHEVDAYGIAAMIYSNRASAMSKEKTPRQLEAVRCELAALALNPIDSNATNNLQASFVNWGPALLKEKKFEDAVRVMAFGQDVEPKSRDIANNHSVVWAKYIEATLDAGKDDDAMVLIGRVSKVLPNEKDYKNAGYWYRRCSDACLTKKDAAGSLKVLLRAKAMKVNDKELDAALVYHVQEALPMVEAKSGRPAMIEHFTALKATYPDSTPVIDGAKNHAIRTVDKLIKAQKFQDALDVAKNYEALLPTKDKQIEVAGIAYDDWAGHLASKKDFAAAYDKYKEGLAAYPEHKRLSNNFVATVDQWARPAMDKKNWDEAIGIYNKGLQVLNNDGHLKHNKDYCEKMKGK